MPDVKIHFKNLTIAATLRPESLFFSPEDQPLHLIFLPIQHEIYKTHLTVVDKTFGVMNAP